MWYHVIGIPVIASMFYWIRLDRIVKNAIGVVLLLTFPHIWISPPSSTKGDHVCQQKQGSFCTNFLFYLCLNKFISIISNIYNPDNNICLEFQTMCVQIFSDLKLDHTFHVFWLSTCIICCLFSYVEIFHMLWRWEFVGIHCELIPDWIISTLSRILFPAQYRTKIEILLGKIFQK